VTEVTPGLAYGTAAAICECFSIIIL